MFSFKKIVSIFHVPTIYFSFIKQRLLFCGFCALQEAGHKLILWTFRDGEYLKEAVEYCLNHGIMFYAVNQSSPDEEFNKYMSRKIHADVFIDDRNVGGFPGWAQIRKWLLPELSETHELMDETKRKKKGGFLKDIFG